jgi:hypothetical protein
MKLSLVGNTREHANWGFLESESITLENKFCLIQQVDVPISAQLSFEAILGLPACSYTRWLPPKDSVRGRPTLP